MKPLKVLVITAALTVALGITTARAYDYDDNQTSHDSRQGFQAQSRFQNQPSLSQQVHDAYQVDPRAFNHTLSPDPNAQNRSTGVIIGPNGQAWYWYQNGR